MLPSFRSKNIKGLASSVQVCEPTMCFNLSRVCIRFDVRPARSSFQHLRHVCGCSPAKNCCRNPRMDSLRCMLSKLAVLKLNFWPESSRISSSARQQGRTVPMGDASKLIQGSTQNFSVGKFILMLPIPVICLNNALI